MPCQPLLARRAKAAGEAFSNRSTSNRTNADTRARMVVRGIQCPGFEVVFGKPVTYCGNDLNVHQRFVASLMPSWAAYDLRLMLARFHADGMLGMPRVVDTPTSLLGHALRSYRNFAAELANAWQQA